MLWNPKTLKWLTLVFVASTFLLDASGICVRRGGDISPEWLVSSCLISFLWLALLVRFRLFTGSLRLPLVLATLGGFNLLSQLTGADQSPVTYAVFLFIGIAAWDGGSVYGYGVAIFFSLLEALSLRREDVPEGLVLYLRWGAFLATAFFISRAAKMRTEKEKLNDRLESLKSDAAQFTSSAEPSSFDVSKDVLLKEESRLSARVGAVMELEESLGRQLSLFRQSLSLHTAAFFMMTSIQGKKTLRLRAYSSLSDAMASDITIVPGETLVGLAAKEGRRVLLNQLGAESAKALPYYLKPNPIISFLAQPIYLESGQESDSSDEREMAGVLVLDHSEPDFFSEKTLELTELFTRLLADTIHNVKILHFSRAKSRNLHALYEVSNSFASSLETKSVLETALKTAKEIAPCDSAYLALPENEKGNFKVHAWWGPSRAMERPDHLEEELASWIWENKKPIRYTRGLKQGGLGAFERKEGMLGSIQSFLMVPLLAGTDVLGVIRLNSRQANAFQEYDQDILTTLANQTAMALDNALLVQQIHDMAVRDGLTGVYNHRYFQEKLAEELAKAERYNKDLSLLLLDVDHFKKFNDNYGHQEGDRVLKIVSDIVQGTVRQKIDLVARYGGEEFVVILPEVGRERGKRVGRADS